MCVCIDLNVCVNADSFSGGSFSYVGLYYVLTSTYVCSFHIMFLLCFLQFCRYKHGDKPENDIAVKPDAKKDTVKEESLDTLESPFINAVELYELLQKSPNQVHIHNAFYITCILTYIQYLLD